MKEFTALHVVHAMSATCGCSPCALLCAFRVTLCRRRIEQIRASYQEPESGVSPSPDLSIDAPLDPFYDRFPWFRLIGRTFVYISNLYYGVPLEQTVPIVNEKADIVGFLRIAVHPLSNAAQQSGAVDAGDTIAGKRIRQSGSARVEFSDDDVYFRAHLGRAFTTSQKQNAAIAERGRPDYNQEASSGIDCAANASIAPQTTVQTVGGPSDSESGCFSQLQSVPAGDTVDAECGSMGNPLTDELLDPRDLDAAALLADTTLQIDTQFRFRVCILQVHALSSDYTDVFCQFK